MNATHADTLDTTVTTIDAQYEAGLLARRAAWTALDRRHARFGYARLAIAGLALAILFVGGLAASEWLFLPLALFVVTAYTHARVLNARDSARSAVSFYEQGLRRIRHEWIGHGRGGDEYRPADHLYADDLDMFGRGSLFELLDTARTRAGEGTLAAWLLAPATHEEARARQTAVRELAGRLDLREAVAVLGEHARVAVDAPLLRTWATAGAPIAGLGVRVGVAVLVIATVGTLAWWWQTGEFARVAGVLLLAQMIVGGLLRPRVAALAEAVDEPSHDLDVLAGLLRTIERERFTSPRLQALQRALSSNGGAPASDEIARLSRLVAMLASRRNVMFALPAALVMWSTQWAFAIDAWKQRAGVHIPRWLDEVGEFEALLALGAFAAEHPGYVFPDLVDGPARLETEGLAHVTMAGNAVPNDMRIGGADPHLAIVSGSNMSGKSTWIRTVGVSVVLARMGAPVRARVFRVTPLAIGAAIRVQDSLTDGRSRFYAEIVRLKQIVDLARGEEGRLLFLLDEILSGTNSHDRRIGAEAVMTGLVREGAIGLVTTHDLALASIAARLGATAANAHFDDRFAGGRLHFDYTLKPGVVETSNALALMRSIGLDV